MKTFKVWTFVDRRPGKPLRVSHIQAYTKWCPSTWPNLMVIEVEANSGEEAKKIAKQKRLEAESDA